MADIFCEACYAGEECLTHFPDPEKVEGPCSDGFCIASFCDGVNHVDATGYAWEESK